MFNNYSLNFDTEFKEMIHKRDNHACRICGVLNLNEVRLVVHHIDGNKANTTLENCILLCVTCHGQVHSDIAKWQVILTTIAKMSTEQLPESITKEISKDRIRNKHIRKLKKRSAYIKISTDPEIKRCLEKIAKERNLSLSLLCDNILRAWLDEKSLAWADRVDDERE